MPLFGYRCQACGHQWDDLAGRDSPRAVPCPLCRGEGMRLLASGMKFKYRIGSFFEPFVTEDILPGGEPVLVESPEHERKLCRENGLRPVPGRETHR